MNNLIIKFVNKLNPTDHTNEIQIDHNVDIDGLKTLLNTIIGKDSVYFFFYKNNRIFKNLTEITEKHNLNVEETLEIQFIDTVDMKADHLNEYDETVISLCMKSGNIYYLTYSGDLYRYDDNQKMNNSESKIKKISSSSNLLLGITTNDCVLDIEMNKVIFQSEESINSIDVFEDKVVIASDHKITLIENSELNEIYSCEGTFIRDVRMNDKMIVWIEKHNIIKIYNIYDANITSITPKYSLNKIELRDSKIFFTTGNNVILILQDFKLVRNIDLPYRLTNYIKAYKSSIFYSSQHDVILLDIQNETNPIEEKLLRVDGQINDILIDNDKLMIANDNFISTFQI